MAVLVAMGGTATSCPPTNGDLESDQQLTELVDALDAKIPAIMQDANTPGDIRHGHHALLQAGT